MMDFKVQRNQRNQSNKIWRQFEKIHKLQTAKNEVDLYEKSIERIHSIHKKYVEPIDWKSIESTIAPYSKGQIGPKELAAQNALANYKPSIWDRLFNKIGEKKEKLTNNIIEAKFVDEQAYNAWEEQVNLAKKISELDTEAYLKVIESVNPFENITAFARGFQYSVLDSNTVIVAFDVHPIQIIPINEKTLTKTGKLSVKEMSKSKINGMYQDYVCSCVFRIARDLFAIIPANQVVIHAMGDILNTSTGFVERETILSVRITRKQLNMLNFEHIDCSDALNNFEHNMNFVKTSGFKAVAQVNPSA